MARGFSGTGQYLENTTNVGGPANFTIATKLWPLVTTLSSIVGRDSSGESLRSMQFRINGGNVELIVFVGNAAYTATSATISLTAWSHAVGTYDGETVSVYLNGSGSPATNTTPSGNADSDSTRFLIGARYNAGSYVDLFNGYLAEMGHWDTKLNDDEIDALNGGICPLSVRPQNLLRYWPLTGSGNEPDWVGATHMTAVGSPAVIDHPPMSYPPLRRRAYVLPSVGGGQPPRSMHQFRLRRAA